MGISVEFDPELALRNISQYLAGKRKAEECIPEPLETDVTYSFLKKEQRNFWLLGEIPLIETKGHGNISRPKASVQILEATHFLNDGEIWTKGKYKVIEVFDDGKVHFEGTDQIGARW